MILKTIHDVGAPVFYLRNNGNVGTAAVSAIKTQTKGVEGYKVEYLLSDDHSIWRSENKLFKSREELAQSIAGVSQKPAQTSGNPPKV